MQNGVILFLLLAVGANIAGCGQRKDVVVTETNQEKTAEQQTKGEEVTQHQEHSKHGDHQHAFADPAKKKWDDPERDQWQHPEEIVAALALKPGATVADIGAGTGYMVAPLSTAVGQDGTVIAIDISAEMVEYLVKRKAELRPATIVPRKVEPDDPAFPTASVDGVMTLDTWHHIHAQEAYAKKVYDGLKPGGRFVVVDYEVEAEQGPPKAMRLAPEQVAKHLAAVGFRVEVLKESMPRHYMVVGYK